MRGEDARPRGAPPVDALPPLLLVVMVLGIALVLVSWASGNPNPGTAGLVAIVLMGALEAANRAWRWWARRH